ncbi:PREDICTED: TNF receptor-associated factor 5 [Nicrophorus vespilloides]|uniref:TNF receptor-associated factor 5 n=1 Tax=Nicrophorus vespilloides TaxID=110193 RepID=A0ABM1MP54_NICVS|nr:PREDICTED: TNF receptor-associated factor 5 [Nicrophorus vespilloides]
MNATNGSRFRCYFCNKEIEKETEQGHMTTCGSVLEPCPKKCGSYVPRNMKNKHAKVCQNRRSLGEQDLYGTAGSRCRTSKLDNQNIYESLRPMPAAYSNNSHLERTINDLSSKINSLLTNQLDSTRIHQQTNLKVKNDLEKLASQNQSMQEFRSTVQNQMDSLRKELKTFDKLKRDNEITIHNIQESIKEIQLLSQGLTSSKVALKEEQIFNRENFHEIALNLQEIKDKTIEENAVVAALWNDQKQQIERIASENDEFEKTFSELNNKISSLGFDIRAAGELSTECVEKLKQQQKEIDELRNNLAQTKLDVELAEDSVSSMQGLISTTPGRIIWKISDFLMKLESAKKQERVPLKGPVFYSGDYGYRLRLLVFLNGLRKWKGRYLLACIQVMKGDYDDLLKWPCKIEANVVLKDCEMQESGKDYYRYITAKGECPNDDLEDPNESSTQYIFIPHSTLTRSNYLKNDSIYLEIKIAGKAKNETHV